MAEARVVKFCNGWQITL